MSVVLVTGSSGMVGRNLCRHLKNNQFEVIGLDYQTPDSPPDLQPESIKPWLGSFGLDGFLKYRLGENSDDLRASILEKLNGVEYVIHLASQSHVDRSISHPQQFVIDNVAGTLELLEMCRSLPNLQRIVHFSTDEVVACVESGSAKEDATFRCGSVYSATKGAQELLVQAYIKTHKLPIVTTRCVNIFGPEQNIEKFIPKIVWSAVNDQKVPIYGDGSQTREWVHVDHVCDVINWAMLNTYMPNGKVVHIVGTKEIQNIVIANLILGRLGKSHLIEHVADRLGHDVRYSLDAGDAHVVWDMPTYQGSFVRDLFKTVDWYLGKLVKELPDGIR